MAGNAIIGALRVVLGLDSAQFETGLKGAQSKLSAFGKAAAIAGAVAGAAAAVAGSAVAVAVKKSLDSFDELSKTAQKTGVPIEALGRLKYAGELADVSLEQLSTGMRKLSVNMLQTAKGAGGPAAEAFKQLGISVADSNGRLRNGEAVLQDVAAKFATMNDGATKTALAVQIFGKSGAELIPLLNSGADGLKEMGAEAEKLGLIIDQKTGSAAEQFNDNLTRMHAALAGVTTQVSAGIAPALADLSDGLVAAAKAGDGLRVIGEGLGIVTKFLASALIDAGASVSITAKAFGAFADILGKVFTGDFKGAVEAYKKHDAELRAAMRATGDAVTAIWQGAGKSVKAAAPAVGEDLAAPAAHAAKKVKEAKSDLEKEIDSLKDLAKSAEEDLATRGMTPEQQRIRELGLAYQRAEAAGNKELAATLLELRGRYLELTVEIGKATIGTKEISGLIQSLPSRVEFTSSTIDDLTNKIEQAADVFYRIGNAVDDIFYGFKNRDWVAAFQGLMRAVQQLKAAFDSAATAGDKVAAVAGVGNAVGNAVGGTAGKAISGAASGAAVGFTVAGPIGAAAGAIIGGLSALFGASKAKKRAREEAAARAAAEAAQKAAQEAATKRELEIQLMELSGKALEAQAAREQDLLNTLSPANQELQKQVFALQHEADARAAAAAAAQQQAQLQNELFDATGNASAALKLFRDNELAALPEAFRPAKQAIYAVIDATNALTAAQEEWATKVAAADSAVADARSALADAAQAEGERLQGVIDNLKQIGQALADFNRELTTGLLSPRAQQSFTLSQFNALAGKTDAASLAALPDAGRALIEAAKASAPNRAALNAVIAKVSQQVSRAQDAAAGQLSAAQQQLQALHDQTSVLLGVKDGVLSVAAAIAGLSNALFAQQEVQAAREQAIYDLAQAATAAAAAAQALVDAAKTPPTAPPANDTTNAFVDTVSGQTDLMTAVVVNTNRMATILEDVTYGGATINTAA